jgi:hypothetical protein
MRQGHHNTWKKNKLVKMVYASIKKPFNELLQEFGLKRSAPHNSASHEQNSPSASAIVAPVDVPVDGLQQDASGSSSSTRAAIIHCCTI